MQLTTNDHNLYINYDRFISNILINKKQQMKKDKLSYSALTQFSKSPNHLLSYWNREFEPTPAMQFGSLLHKMILEADDFHNEYVVFEGTRRGKIWNEYKAINEDKIIVTQKEYNIARNVYDKAMKSDMLRKLLMETNETEKHIEWQYNEVNYHGYCDMVGENFIADIKIVADAGEKFARDLRYNDYSLQAAMYLKGLPKANYYIIAIEKSSPYNVQVYRFGDLLLGNAEKRYYYLNEQYKDWNGEPQSYSSCIVTVGDNEFISV